MARTLVKVAGIPGDWVGNDPKIGFLLPCNFKTDAGTTLTIFKGTRRTPFGIVQIPDKTITAASNFNNFDDITEAGTYGSSGFRYLYAKLSDTSKIALSTNSPYAKNGGISNIVTISSTQWVYIGAVFWTGTAYYRCRSSGEKVYWEKDTISQPASNTFLYLNGAFASSAAVVTATKTLVFGSMLPGASTNTKSRVASEVEVIAICSANHRNDSGSYGLYSMNLKGFDQNFENQQWTYVKTPDNGGGFFRNQPYSHIRVFNCLEGTDTIEAVMSTSSGINNADGFSNAQIGIRWYRDQYIFI